MQIIFALWLNNIARELVVPWSIARMYFFIIIFEIAINKVANGTLYQRTKILHLLPVGKGIEVK